MSKADTPTCDNCLDVVWVCENHDTAPWSDTVKGGCTCGAGMPCPVCNEHLERGYGMDFVVWSVDGMPGTKGWVQ